MEDQKEVPKEYVRLVHPDTGDFIAEYYVAERYLKITKHRKTAIIWLNEVDEEFYSDGIKPVKAICY